MSKRLQNKVAVITGGNSGIGLATAQLFVEQGARVAILGRDEKTLKAAAEGLGPAALAVQGDISRMEDLDRLYARTTEAFGKVDIVFANAGVVQLRTLEETDEALFDKLVSINFKGTYFTVQKALPHLNEKASIILNTSLAGSIGVPMTSAYAATKAAVRSLARSFAAELVGRGIRVNALSPGAIHTPIGARMDSPREVLMDYGAKMMARIPMKRLGAAEEVARAALFLASDESSYVLGAELTVDGGVTQL
ncbi:glucose 1-dehydrogenase [Pyxidicoccus fallax]|uniref:Glucose 1-dehydrogenase n=1 Tax=Pyxidicoccus fallax TaxID=394095 RepID=A0A848LC96_9BACT|nr:glucose 1-dehydrogenase [Pyxidicoccus fallax]NMO14353.1 glucose 1-dehydrogenase [Pyxidicoccus fallax]NPC77142.1 glucose 1-dehydrogenase [Pyxidicoccus fallax]